MMTKSEIKNPQDAYKEISALTKNLDMDIENILMTTIRGNIPVRHYHIGMGDVDCCTLSKKNVAKKAILDMATGVILYHNHPSGNLQPSAADIKRTEEIRNTLKVFDITLIDHIILSENRIYSFSEEKTLKI